MKILDRYVAKNFLTGYLIAFGVLMGLRVIIDLFVNLDEFAEHENLATMDVIRNVATFYAVNSAVYFRDFAGMITVVAAAFSFGRMVRNRELVAVMASGVSLKRVIGPILFLALIFTGLLVVDQEIIIPRLADDLSRRHDDIPGQETYDAWFLTDDRGSLISSVRFEVNTDTLVKPTIITRKASERPGVWKTTGCITADKAVYDYDQNKWRLVNGRYSVAGSEQGAQAIDWYDSGDLTPREIPIRHKADSKTLLSSRQLSELAKRNTKIKDLAQLYSQKHFRMTDPLINYIMLMVSLPILVCRDPRSMKSATAVSFALTGACFLTTFVCKLFATEVVFYRVMPELWAWLPVAIFLPIAFIELDSMKT